MKKFPHMKKHISTAWLVSGLIFSLSTFAANKTPAGTGNKQPDSGIDTIVNNPEANSVTVGGPIPASSDSVGRRINYQGMLRLNNNRAQGVYDFQFRVFDSDLGGNQLDFWTTPGTLVEDGLFAVELQFPNLAYDDSSLWLEVLVREENTGPYTILTPRQRINPVPFAVRTEISGNGSSGPWTLNAQGIHYNAGNVGIGTGTPEAPLHINTNSANLADEVVKLEIDSVTRFSINTNGGATIGLGLPSALGTPPPNGLRVLGRSELWDQTSHFGDVKQIPAAGGILKAAVFLACGGTDGTLASILRSEQNVIGSGIQPIVAVNRGDGICDINMGFDIDRRFWQISTQRPPLNGGSPTVANCRLKDGTTTTLRCAVSYYSLVNEVFQSPAYTVIMLLVY